MLHSRVRGIWILDLHYYVTLYHRNKLLLIWIAILWSVQFSFVIAILIFDPSLFPEKNVNKVEIYSLDRRGKISFISTTSLCTLWMMMTMNVNSEKQFPYLRIITFIKSVAWYVVPVYLHKKDSAYIYCTCRDSSRVGATSTRHRRL